MYKTLIYVFLQCSVIVLCFKPETPCKRNDFQCYTNIGRAIMNYAILGDTKRGIQTLDPLFIEVTEAKLPTVEYSLKDYTGIGFKEMIITGVKKYEPNTLQIDLFFPYYEITGDYDIKGKVMNINIEGKGKAFLNATNIHLVIDTTEEIYEKKGKKYLKFGKFEVKAELLGILYLDLENLFNENKERADPVLKFINDNYKDVARLLQDPFILINIRKLIENCNKILAEIPLGDIVINLEEN